MIKKAYKNALINYRDFRQQIKSGILTDELLGKKRSVINTQNSKMLNIAVLGHGYNLYDSYTNMDVLTKLKEMGANVTTIDMVDGSIIRENSKYLNKKTFWYFGTKILGSTFYLLDKGNIDGIIYIMSFGCGVDSFVCDLVERNIRRAGNIPFTILTIDEQTGEAGLNTRIEAFIDMIRWRDNYENNISSYGKPIYMR